MVNNGRIYLIGGLNDLWLSIQLGMSSSQLSQLTKSYFSEGWAQPPTREYHELENHGFNMF